MAHRRGDGSLADLHARLEVAMVDQCVLSIACCDC